MKADLLHISITIRIVVWTLRDLVLVIYRDWHLTECAPLAGVVAPSLVVQVIATPQKEAIVQRMQIFPSLPFPKVAHEVPSGVAWVLWKFLVQDRRLLFCEPVSQLHIWR